MSADAGDVDAIVRVLDEHAGCVANGQNGGEGSGDTGVDVWSCGLEVPYVDSLETMERLHLARALERLLAEGRRVAWDEGASAFAAGRGSDANPYARWTR